MRIRWIIAGVVAVAFMAVSLSFVPDAPWRTAPESELAAGGTAPAAGGACEPDAPPANLDFTMQDMHEEDVALSQYRGQVIVLNFWATWCGPCRFEIPDLVALQDRYRDEGLVVLGLSVDDPVAKLRPFAEEMEMNYPVLVGLNRDDVQQAYGPIWGLPATFVISRDGNVCRRHMGLATQEQLEAMVRPLL